MLHFDSDYMEGACPQILQRLQEINLDKNTGYGLDPYCESAKSKILKACDAPDARVHFLVGGTQTNMLMIDAMLRFNEGVIAAESGHINVHESGAIEGCGHKVMPVKAKLGKIDIPALKQWLEAFYAETSEVGFEHYVMPRAIYISNPTELGTLYALDELQQLRDIADQYGFYLYMDGARMGYGLAAEGGDVTLADVARLCDAFYIGGTKVGALFGEAVVITNPDIEFTRGLIKHRGAMLAKGWLLGVQFDELFSETESGELLYMHISRNAIKQAMRLRSALEEKGYEIYIDSPTNQQFAVLSNTKIDQLRAHEISFSYISPVDAEKSVVRFCTSWATSDEQINTLINIL